jgi:flagellar biosynthetic protein FlhB
MPEDMGEKTEDPTPKKREDARKEGKLAKSTDLSAAIIMIGATLVMALFGVRILSGLALITRRLVSPDTLAADLTGARVVPDAALAFEEVVRIVTPVMAVMFVFAAFAQVTQVGLMLSAKTIQPKLSKLNPLSGAKRLFSLKSAVKGGMDVLKLAALSLTVILVIRSDFDELVALAALPLSLAVEVAAWMMLEVAIWALVVLLLVGFLDFWYQKWQHNQDLRMTKHEVKDERKAAEGDVETKGRRLRLSRQIAMQRLGQDVPQADVVVANPTHFAVALRYDQASMSAPRVIAKGADYLALKIRYIAAAHGVPIVERPPLARAIYHDVAVGQEVHAEHYEAVAEVLAYVYRLEGRAAAGAS